MIEAFFEGNARPIHLPDDTENPTVFWAEPITDETWMVWQSLEEWLKKKAAERRPEGTVDAVVESARQQATERRLQIASLIQKIDNAPPDGRTIEGTEAIAAFLKGLPRVPFANLVGAMLGALKTDDLTFRGNTAAGTAEPQESGREEA